MTTSELRVHYEQLENIIDSMPDIKEVIIDNPLLLTENFEKNNQERIQIFLETKREMKRIKIELMTDSEKIEYENYQNKLREKYSNDN